MSPAWFVAVTRRYPFNRGRDFFFRNFVRGQPLQEKLATLPNPRLTRRGFPVFCNPCDVASDWIKVWGEHERITEKFLLAALAHGGTFLDVGANIGYFSLLVGHEYSDRCQVLAFEPNPPIFALLQAGIERSRGAKIIHSVPLAVSDHAGRLEFILDPENTGHSRLRGSGESARGSPIDVVTLDAWLDEKPPPSKIAAIKLDVEGCELRALRGMERTLRQHQPALVVEIIDEHLRDFGDSRAEPFAFLDRLGYATAAGILADQNLYLQAPAISR